MGSISEDDTSSEYEDWEEESSTEYEGWAAWEAEFKPSLNHFRKTIERRFETDGEEQEFVKSQDETHVWTLVSGDNCVLLVAGYAHVNALSYFVTERPWRHEADFVLVSVDNECECFDEARYEETGIAGDPNCDKCAGSGYVTKHFE
jgi:hypothetical protein